MRSTRRDFLAIGLGATQLALLDRFKLIRSAKAETLTDAPTKLLTIYVNGGVRQYYQWWPNSDADVDTHVPAPSGFADIPTFFTAKDLIELGPANGNYTPLRTARKWDPADPSKLDPRYVTPLGYVWASPDYKLWENTAVLHGIDQGTNAHFSGYVSCMCGVAGGNYRAPAIQSVIANHLYERFKDSRPLPCVAIESSGMPNALTLPAASSAILVPDASQLKETLSADPASNPWWTGLDARRSQPETALDGTRTGENVSLTNLELSVLDATRPFRARSTKGTDRFLEQIYGGYQGVSKVLARDVASILEKTKGVEHIGIPDYAKNVAAGYFGWVNSASYRNVASEGTLDMALRLLKSNLATSVHARMNDPRYDTHLGMQGHLYSSAHLRGTFDVIGRLLAEMKATPATGPTAKPGKTLLDDTLVLITSEFGRNFASGPSQSSPDGWGAPDDHHPYMTVTYVGGGVAGNRQIGSYKFPEQSGTDVDLIDEGGAPQRHGPHSSDVMATVARIFGLKPGDDFFIPGGYAEVVGIRRT